MRTRYVFLSAVLLIVHPLLAGSVTDELKRYGQDAAAMVRAPLTWDEQMWRRAATVLAADGAAFAADQQIADFVQRNRSDTSDHIADVFTPFGGRHALYVSGATLLTGVLTHRPQLRDTGRDAVEASVLAAGIVTPVIKKLTGRSRPLIGEGAYAFDPLSANESFPSGHATNAFAVASVFAAHSKGRLVPIIAYTIATGVAAARMNDNVHYTSDVIAGAAIGTAVGRSIVARHRRTDSRPAEKRVWWSVAPYGRGVSLDVSIRLNR